MFWIAEVSCSCYGAGQAGYPTSDLVFVLRKTQSGEPLVNAVLVPVKDVFAVVGDVHVHEDGE